MFCGLLIRNLTLATIFWKCSKEWVSVLLLFYNSLTATQSVGYPWGPLRYDGGSLSRETPLLPGALKHSVRGLGETSLLLLELGRACGFAGNWNFPSMKVHTETQKFPKGSLSGWALNTETLILE